jgi:hypothetical protein
MGPGSLGDLSWYVIALNTARSSSNSRGEPGENRPQIQQIAAVLLAVFRSVSCAGKVSLPSSVRARDNE